jgi:peptide deformylase
VQLSDYDEEGIMSDKPKSLTIITYGHPTLRVKCAPVTAFDDKLHTLAADMEVTMHENDGMGLAASQVNVPIQLLVIGIPEKDDRQPIRLIAVNPEILESRGSWDYEEGCLSVPDLRDIVTRPEWIRLRYQDLSGRVHEIETDGILARVLQHEIDHLNGILFVDHLSPVRRALMKGKLKKLAAENVNSCM